MAKHRKLLIKPKVAISELLDIILKLFAIVSAFTYLVGFIYGVGCTSVLKYDTFSDASYFLHPFSQSFIIFHGIFIVSSISFVCFGALLFKMLLTELDKYLLKLKQKKILKIYTICKAIINPLISFLSLIFIILSPNIFVLTNQYLNIDLTPHYKIVIIFTIITFIIILNILIHKAKIVFNKNFDLSKRLIIIIISIEFFTFILIDVFTFSKFNFINSINNFTYNKSNIKLVKVFSDENSYAYYYPLDISENFFIGIDPSKSKSVIISRDKIAKFQSEDIPVREAIIKYSTDEKMINYLNTKKSRNTIEDFKAALLVVDSYYKCRTIPDQYNPDLFLSIISDNYNKRLLYPSKDILKSFWEKNNEYRNKDINDFIGNDLSVPFEECILGNSNTSDDDIYALNIYSFECWKDTYNETIKFQLIKNELTNKWEINDIVDSVFVDLSSN
ncbi:hypothetical protein [Clostridium intestinale]|uniref:Uncharacterized protein n=1 Tax=Clostridium intestinale TaxID=36845 RepID=A0A7D6VTD5_9CLOT|nr:hypothetical protein [Clostridium intestinale]QLY81946.1 hypothetical protein HZF06_10275 [Clostridium intestinale]